MKSYLMVILAMGGSAIAAPPTDESQQPLDESGVDESPAEKPIGINPVDEREPAQTEKSATKVEAEKTAKPKKMTEPENNLKQVPTKADAEVFFKFNSAQLSDNGRTALLNLAEHAKDANGTQIVLDAHADSRGPSPYNVRLTVHRAETVRNFLTENGYSGNRIVMAMYGEDGPRRSKPALDRRVSVTITAEPLYSIIDGSKDATAVVWAQPVTIAEIDGPADKIPTTARR